MYKLDPILKKRINAFTIDLFLVVLVNYFLMASFTDFLKIVFFHFPIATQMQLIHKFKYIHSVSLLSLMFSYYSVFFYATNGQTMGKMLMNLKIESLNKDDKEITLKIAMMRSIAYIVSAWFASIPLILPFIRKDQKSLADIFSNSKVVLIDSKIETFETEFQLTLMEYVNSNENVYNLENDNSKTLTDENENIAA
jgi:uncharacterized RDD family membrane protein YckC